MLKPNPLNPAKPFRISVTFVPSCRCEVIPGDDIFIHKYSEARSLSPYRGATLEVVWQPHVYCPSCGTAWDIRSLEPTT